MVYLVYWIYLWCGGWVKRLLFFCLVISLPISHLRYIYIYIYIYLRFFWLFTCGQKYRNIKAHICWKRHNKKWTFISFEKFYHLNLLEMILNESSYNFRFLIKNPSHIFLGKLLILIYYPKMFSIHQNAAFSKLWYSWNNGAVKLFFFLWVVTLRANQLI